ncbi:hypothetical protein D9M68_888030 [compost metagenome]
MLLFVRNPKYCVHQIARERFPLDLDIQWIKRGLFHRWGPIRAIVSSRYPFFRPIVMGDLQAPIHESIKMRNNDDRKILSIFLSFKSTSDYFLDRDK